MMGNPVPGDLNDDGVVDMEDARIQAHLAAQDGVPDGFVKLDTGELRPLGGHGDGGDDE